MNLFVKQVRALSYKNLKALARPSKLAIFSLLPIFMLLLVSYAWRESFDNLFKELKDNTNNLNNYNNNITLDFNTSVSILLNSAKFSSVVLAYNALNDDVNNHENIKDVMSSFKESQVPGNLNIEIQEFSNVKQLRSLVRDSLMEQVKVDHSLYIFFEFSKPKNDSYLIVSITVTKPNVENLVLQGIEYSLLSAISSASGREKFKVSIAKESLLESNINKISTKNSKSSQGQNYTREKRFNMVIFMITLAIGLGSAPFLIHPLFTVTDEKRKGLVTLMRQMNLKESAYWLSILLTMFLVVISSSLIISATVTYGGDRLFENVFNNSDSSQATLFKDILSFGYLWVLIMASQLQLVGMGVFCSSFLRGSVSVNFAAVFMTGYSINGPMGFSLSSTGGFESIASGSSLNTSIFFLPMVSVARYLASVFDGTGNLSLSLSSFQQSLLVLIPILSCLFSFLLAWYLNQITGDIDRDFPKSPSFFLMENKLTTSSVNNEKTTVATSGFSKTLDSVMGRMEELKQASKNSLITYKLSKSYQNKGFSVNEFSAEFKSGFCYVLLGPNGCGKTSLMNMLSGASVPTCGHTFLFGSEIKRDNIESIFPQISKCSQNDLLWSNLTPEDHVRIFALFRGIKGACKSQSIDGLLSLVNLVNVKKRRVSELSGGMKRRLSFLLATMGDPKVLFLDEPTTGMDPVNRRAVWERIEELKRDRIVLLSTHSMEEADSLGDHIFIMNSGRIVASGNSLFLKNHYGLGYQVKIISEDPVLQQDLGLGKKQSNHSSILDKIANVVVNQILPENKGKIISNAASELVIGIPRDTDLHAIIRFMRVLQGIQQVSSSKISWSISNSSLEEVFLTVSKDSEILGSHIRDNGLCMLCGQRKYDGLVTLFNENGLPVQLPNLVCLQCCGVNEKENLTTKSKTPTVDNQSDDIARFVDDICSPPPPRTLDSIVSPITVSSETLSEDRTQPPSRLQILWNQFIACFRKNYTYTKRKKRMNYFSLFFILSTIVAISILGHLQSSDGTFDVSDVELRDPLIIIPGKEAKSRPSPQEDFTLIEQHGENIFLKASTSGNPNVSQELEILLQKYVPSGVRIYEISHNSIFTNNLSSITIMYKVQISLLVFLSMVFLYRIVNLIILEKFGRIHFYLRVSGVPNAIYWISHIVYYTSILTSINLLTILILGLVGWFKFGINYVILSFVVLIWSLFVVSLGVSIGVFSTSKKAGILISLISVVISTISTWYQTDSLRKEFLWLGPLSFGRILYSLWNKSNVSSEMLLTYFLVLIVNIVILLTLPILYQEFKLRYPEHSLFSYFLHVMKKLSSCSQQDSVQINLEDDDKWIEQIEDSEAREEARMLCNGNLDEKGTTEIVFRKISKVLRNPFKSTFDRQTTDQSLLKNLTFSLQKGECFALLGKNGSGKTTLLSILLGLRSSDSGEALFSVRKDDNQSELTTTPPLGHVGVCPQYDALYEQLTVEEHLSFYSQLHGYWGDSRGRKIFIRALAEMVGLDGNDFSQMAESLSGGQRRRLSIAIALVSRPKLVILDEPTTGVDPENRQKIWNIIDSLHASDGRHGNNATTRCTVLLTTHMMEEADALANRIGILGDGNFQALGSPIALKQRFGSGYSLNLVISVANDSQEEEAIVNIMKFIASSLKISVACVRLGRGAFRKVDDDYEFNSRFLDSPGKFGLNLNHRNPSNSIDLSGGRRGTASTINLSSLEHPLSYASDLEAGIGYRSSCNDTGVGFSHKLNVQFTIALRSIDMTKLFEALIKKQNDPNGEEIFRILEWELSPSTMEDIFLDRTTLAHHRRT